MIFTFYSYKGGVGRSLALAHVAYAFAQRGLRVLAVDFDLEAPGLERYCFAASDGVQTARDHAGLIDLILAYRRALTSPAEFKAASFRDWKQFVLPVRNPVNDLGGRLDLMTAGRRGSRDHLRDYSLTVRTFDWPDFFHNWNGDGFFKWLRDEWTRADVGYDVVLVDSRTGVTEMGGVCAYQLADVAVLLCAPNDQNLDGTVDVARDFMSPGVLALRGGRPLRLLAVPTRLEPEHPSRDKFLKRFADLLGPPGFGPEVDVSYADLALPYLPPFSVSEPIIDGPGPQATPAERDAFKTLRAFLQRLAEGLTLFAPQTSRLGAQRATAIAALRGGGRSEATPLHADTSRRSAGYDFFIDYGVEDGAAAHELARLLRAANFEVFIDIGSAGSGTRLPSEIERALDYSACVLLCFGASSTSASRKDLLMRARASARPLRLVPVLLPHGSADAPHSFGLEIYQFLDLRDGVEASALERLVASQRQGPGAGSDDDPAPANPYRGPLPYGEDDARLLFGRDAETAQVLGLLDDLHAVWIEGAAKVGKTSLVMAGVLPALRAQARSSSAAPHVEVHDASQGGPWPRWRETSDPQVLVIDQVDSFVAGDLDVDRRKRRSDLLELAAARGPMRRLIVIGRGVDLSVAGDSDDDSAGWLSGVPRYEVARLRGDALRQAITEPALKASHLLENGLAERLVESAGEALAAMLQIQLALASLWELRREGWLTNRGLDGLGHLGGVFKRHLQERLAALDEGDRGAARVLFKALCRPGPKEGLVGSLLPWSQARTPQAIAAVGSERLRDLLLADGLLDLWRARNDDGSPGAIQVALVRSNAGVYFDDAELLADGDFLAWRGRLASALTHWLQGGEQPSALLLDSALGEASHWHTLHGDQLTAAERDFIESSLDASLLRSPAPEGVGGSAAVAALEPRADGGERPPLEVEVVNGDLRFVAGPLMLGHYRSLRLTGTEAIADVQVARVMSRSLAAGIYAEQPGTHMIFGNNRNDPDNPLAKARPAVVIVVGLGDEGRLRSVDLVNSVRQGTLAYVERQRDEGGGGAGLSLSVTLLGTGAVGVSAGASARLVVQGVREANEKVAAFGSPGIISLRIVELYHDRASEGWRALRDQAIGQPRGLKLGVGVIATAGALRRALASSYRGVDHDILSAVSDGTPSGDRVIAFTLSTRRASGDVRTQIALAPLVHELVAKASNDAQGDPQVGRVLYELLVPVEVAPFLGGVDEMVIELDAGTAGLPWELLDGAAELAGADRRPWAIRSKLLRKLRTASFRAQGSDSAGGVLVIGEPRVDPSLYPPLPAARAEAQAVAACFQAPGCSLLSGDADARAIINALFERPYRILHVAGHGAPGAGGGIVLSGQTFLGAAEIRAMRTVPELVFINCCHVVEREASALLEQRRYDRVAFAASLAEELIVVGVRCAVVAGWAVQDAASEIFATSFYRSLLDGARYADAVGAARSAAWQAEPGGSTWAAFQCYGDPDWTLVSGPVDRARLPAASGAEFVDIASPVDLALALETIATRSRFGALGQIGIEKVRLLEASYASTWGGMGAVAEAYGLAYAECGGVDEAIGWYRRALAAHDASASLKVAEELGNLLARRGARAADANQARGDLQAAIAHLERVVAVQSTPTREALLASAWKRYALVVAPASADASQEAIRAVARHYGNAERMAREGDLPELYHYSVNAISAESRLAFLARRVPQLEGSRVRATERALATTAAQRPDFWSAVAQIEFGVLVASARRRLAPEAAGAIERFRDLKARVPSPAMWNSVLGEARFTLEPYARMASTGERRAAQAVLDALRELAVA